MLFRLYRMKDLVIAPSSVSLCKSTRVVDVAIGVVVVVAVVSQ